MAFKTNERIDVFFIISIFLFTITVVPTIVVHLNYYTVNRGDVVKYVYQEREIIIKHRGVSINFNLDDIEEVVRYMSFNFAANRSSVLPWDGYNHAVIRLKNGKKLTITSLLVPNLNLPIDAEKIIVKRGLYRLAKKK
ncbi:hypothetical protein QT327_28035 [Olivibacter sp. 47]|uniref:hypothetical protein n=1 Tax=Olivibacter sp. 47 TaxID=3056486 RepID=UPI0025A3425B|nr:hypothetical protein [Olivibacter sp. 47]MDM8178165.1 hypothetical protein [Olivibacter sp. 47]